MHENRIVFRPTTITMFCNSIRPWWGFGICTWMCNMHPVVLDIPDDQIHPITRDRQRQMEQQPRGRPRLPDNQIQPRSRRFYNGKREQQRLVAAMTAKMVEAPSPRRILPYPAARRQHGPAPHRQNPLQYLDRHFDLSKCLTHTSMGLRAYTVWYTESYKPNKIQETTRFRYRYGR